MTGGVGLRRDRRAAVAVEFALVALALLMLVFATIGLGLVWWTENGLRVTAVLTARHAALPAPGSCSDAGSFAVTAAQGWIGAGAISTSNVSCASEPRSATVTTGSYKSFAKVTVTSPLWANTVLPAPFSHLTLSASACYPIQS